VDEFHGNDVTLLIQAFELRGVGVDVFCHQLAIMSIAVVVPNCAEKEVPEERIVVGDIDLSSHSTNLPLTSANATLSPWLESI